MYLAAFQYTFPYSERADLVEPSTRDARIPFFNIRILSISVKNYPYPVRSDVDNWYPYAIRIRGSTMVQYDTVGHPRCSSQGSHLN